ncbi:MAG: hypothetical protein IKX18_07515 [Muribaculaceae bacterium]|nr:hypothetical protein [Muribaculaceae bacterium]
MIDSNDSQKRNIDSKVKSYKGTVIGLALLIILIIVYLLLPQAKEARDDYQGIILKGVFEQYKPYFKQSTNKYGETCYVFTDYQDSQNQFINKDFANQYFLFKTDTEGRSVDDYLNDNIETIGFDTCYRVMFNGYPALYLKRFLELESPVLVYDSKTRISFMQNKAVNTRYIVCLDEDRVYYLSTYGFVDDYIVQSMEDNIEFIDYSKERIKEIMNWALIAILSLSAFAILYLLMKPIKKQMQNKTAFWIGFYISLITLLSLIILAIVIQVSQFTWYGDDTIACVIGVVGHILLIFLPCYLFVRKKATQPFQEDFLVPEWFKRKFYPIIKNKLCLRLLLVFLFYPIYVLITIPWIGLFSLLLVVPIAVLLALSLVVSWIYSGKKEKL